MFDDALVKAADLPPCGGDVRQDRGGRCPADLCDDHIYGYSGNRSVSARTLAFTAASTAALPSSELATFSPSSTSAIRWPISRNSAWPKPRVVPAGVPSLTPEVTNGFSGSNGMPFLLQVMLARPSAASARLPVAFFGPEVDQHQMVVGAVGHDVEPGLLEARGQRLGVGHDVMRIGLEFGPAAPRRTPPPWPR